MTLPCPRVAAAALALLGASACSDSPTSPDTRPTHPDGVLVARARVAGRPFGIAVSRTGIVYVTLLDSASLARFDLPGTVVTGRAPVGFVPTDVGFDPTGSTAFVANQWDGTVGIVNVGSNAQVALVPVGGDPFRVAVSPDGGRVYVGTNAHQVVVVDPLARSVLAVLDSIGLDPNGFAFHPGGQRLYVTGRSSGTLTEVPLGPGGLRRTLDVGGIPQGIAVSPGGDEVYLANENGYLYVVSVASFQKTDSLALEGDGFGLALTPDGTQLYVGMRLAGVVKVVDRISRAVVRELLIGGRPRRIAFDRMGTTAVIANEHGWVDIVR